MADHEHMEVGRQTILSSDNYYRTVDIFYGLLSMSCFVFGTSGNFIAFLYFANKRKDNSTIIYIFITFVDVVISVVQMPAGVSYLGYRKPIIFDNPTFCNIWHFIWQILSRQSVALVAILSITRTLSILFPLQVRISKKVIVFILVLTGVLQVLTGTIMFWFGGRGTYEAAYVDCSNIDIEREYYFYHVIPMLTWYWLPVLPVIASCFISYDVLQRSKSLSAHTVQGGEGNRSDLRRSKDNATMTIVLLTALYVTFNLPLCISNILWTIDDTNDFKYDFFNFDSPAFYFNNLVYCLCVPLNALANPILYFARIKCLRIKMVGKLTGFFMSFVSNNGVRYVNDQSQNEPISPNNNHQINLMARPVCKLPERSHSTSARTCVTTGSDQMSMTQMKRSFTISYK